MNPFVIPPPKKYIKSFKTHKEQIFSKTLITTRSISIQIDDYAKYFKITLQIAYSTYASYLRSITKNWIIKATKTNFEGHLGL
jgi:hypothetical protein